MWILFSFGSALFAGITSILAKIGIRDTDSNTATALRTIVVLIFSWLMVFITGSYATLNSVSSRTFFFLILSGLSTGASWLCYFKALQIGNINKITPVDKSSTILTMLLAFFFLGETITVLKGFCMVLIAFGTWLMIQKRGGAAGTSKNPAERGIPASAEKPAWFFFALGSAVFASLTSILGKIGIEGIDSTLGTAIRTIFVLIMAWVVVFITNKQKTIRDISPSSWIFLILSGLATGGSWLCYYRALQTGPASVVVPIDKLSILVTVAFSWLVFKETLSRRSACGLAMIVCGTLLLLF